MNDQISPENTCLITEARNLWFLWSLREIEVYSRKLKRRPCNPSPFDYIVRSRFMLQDITNRPLYPYTFTYKVWSNEREYTQVTDYVQSCKIPSRESTQCRRLCLYFVIPFLFFFFSTQSGDCRTMNFFNFVKSSRETGRLCLTGPDIVDNVFLPLETRLHTATDCI